MTRSKLSNCLAGDSSFYPGWPAKAIGRFLHLLADLFRVVHIVKSRCFLLALWLCRASFRCGEHAWVSRAHGVLHGMRMVIEDSADLARKRVFKIERAKAQQLIDGACNRPHAGVRVAHGAGLDPRAGHQQNAAVRINVIDAALSVVLRHKE